MISQSIPTSVSKVFSVLPDPRKARNQRHRLLDVVTMAIIAILCGADDWGEVAAIAQAREEWFRRFLAIPHGVPSVDTFRRVFRYIDHRAFERCFIQWVELVCSLTKGKIVSIDGKLLRGSREAKASTQPICVVSAFSTENSLVLGQFSTEEKSNEITAIPLLLEMLDVKDAIVTIDAAGCQKDITRRIVESGGDYVIGLKGNQPTLHDEAVNFFQQALEADFEYLEVDHFRTEEKSRNRYEVREVYVVDDLDWLEGQATWPGLRSLVLVRSTRTVEGTSTDECRYYISSLPADAEKIGTAIRSHWAIENKLHWVLDVAYSEDRCKTRKDHGAKNLSVLRKMTANLIRQHKGKNPHLRGGVKCRRKVAACCNSYLQELLEYN